MVEADDVRISDETLIGRTAAGDLGAFSHLVRRHQGAVYRFLRAAMPIGAGGEAGDGGDADLEATLHDTFAAARRSAARYRDEPSARTWLLVLARRALDRRHPRTSAGGDGVSLRELARLAGQRWLLEERSIASVFDALPPEDREILTLCDREYFTLDEVARVTGLPDSTVRTRLHRARLRLLALWKEDGLGG